MHYHKSSSGCSAICKEISTWPVIYGLDGGGNLNEILMWVGKKSYFVLFIEWNTVFFVLTQKKTMNAEYLNDTWEVGAQVEKAILYKFLLLPKRIWMEEGSEKNLILFILQLIITCIIAVVRESSASKRRRRRMESNHLWDLSHDWEAEHRLAWKKESVWGERKKWENCFHLFICGEREIETRYIEYYKVAHYFVFLNSKQMICLLGAWVR